jgi:hypothetical protein
LRKVGDTTWKSKTKTYSPAKTGSLNLSGKYVNVNENTKYEFKIRCKANGKYYYSQIFYFTTPSSTSLSLAKVTVADAKYSGNNISVNSLIKLEYNGTKLVNGTDYTLSKSTVKGIGNYKIKVTGKDWYKGSITKTIKIYPKTPTIKEVKYNSNGRIVVKWARVANCSKQQVAISKSSTFSSSETCVYSVAANKESASFYKIKFNGDETHIMNGNTYWVRMRAYKTVDGKKIYGKWGSTKKVVCN